MGDSVLRQSFIRFLYQQDSWFSPDKDLLLSEMGLDQGFSRIDLAVINGYLHGFELKSDLDNLNRLPQQVTSYSNFFSYLTVVTAEKHLKKIVDEFPNWIGIYVCNEFNGNITFQKIRKASFNSCVDKKSISRLLWKKEALDILAKYGVYESCKNKSKFYIANQLSEILNLEDLIKELKTTIRSRVDWQVVQQLP